MHRIKIIFIILYIVILGFIVFGNNSVFGEELVQTSPFQMTNSFDQYFINVQDTFDNMIVQDKLNNTHYFDGFWSIIDNYKNYNYYVELTNDTGYGSTTARKRGYIIYFYDRYVPTSYLSSLDKDFIYFNFTDYNEIGTFKYPTYSQACYFKGVVYNNSTSYITTIDRQDFSTNVPFICMQYSHPILNNYLLNVQSSTTGAQQISNAINNQTNTLAEATQSQTNAMLDTNDTGTDTMNITDTTTDTSADLTSLFSNIHNAFTNDNIQFPQVFTLTLPNGNKHNFTLNSGILWNFFNNNPTLKAFYQAFFYVVFGGYVIFDFKKIINRLKEGDIDNLVTTSKPTDVIVNLSMK